MHFLILFFKCLPHIFCILLVSLVAFKIQDSIFYFNLSKDDNIDLLVEFTFENYGTPNQKTSLDSI